MILLSEASDSLKVPLDKFQTIYDQTTGNGLYTFDNHYADLMSNGLLSALFYILLMVGLAFLFYKKEKALDYCDKHLSQAFVAVWILGFVVYDLGMYPDHSLSEGNAFWAMMGVAPMAIIHAFAMFVLQSDVSAIHPGCHNSAWFMFFFSIAHLLAAFISMVFVIKHFGFSIVASFIRFCKTHIWMSNVKNLYVFWGMNDATYYLAKNIVKTGHDKDARIAIIRVNNEKEDPNKMIGMERLFSFLSMSNSKLDYMQELQKLGCLTHSTYGSLTDKQIISDNDFIGRELRLNSIVQLIKHTTGTVHMFVMEEDESFNLQAVGNMKQDKTINEYVEKHQVKFYCHARYNSVHRVIEDEPSHENMEVRVIDSSHISVEILKKKENIHLQPVNYVDIDNEAKVSSAFKALVVGFSEVGMDMVRFLYEFGSFVKAGCSEDNVTRSDFHCDVVDKKMSELAGQFIANAPAIEPRLHLDYKAQTTETPDTSPQSMIDLHEMDCHSETFYSRLKYWLPELNYIVMATEDDELNVSHAVRIFRLAIRYREQDSNLEHLRILVRVKHDKNKHFEKIVDYYNRLWAAQKESENSSKTHQGKISSTEKVEGPITLFGSAYQVYTYAHLVDESLRDKAKAFKDKYDRSIYDQQVAANQEPYPIVSWDDDQNSMLQLKGDYEGFSPTYSGIMKLRRTQSQNMANSLHAATKARLAKEALTEQELDNMRQHGITREAGEMIYKWKDEANEPIDHIQQVMDTLAQTEHLRWCASHEILGYTVGGTPDNTDFKDEAKYQHGCLRIWSALPKNTKSYDYNAVDVSLADYGFYSNENED